MARKASGSGSIAWKADASTPWERGRPLAIRVSTPNGRVFVPLVEGEDYTSTTTEAELYVYAASVSARMREVGTVKAGTGETTNEWFDRYFKAATLGRVGTKKAGKPQVTVADRRSRFDCWIAPIIGTIEMTAVNADHIRKVVDVLDEQIAIRQAFHRGERGRDDKTGRKPGLSPKTAKNVWGELTNAFGEALRSKRKELRVRTDNPTRDVAPPNSDDDREQAALYPSEVYSLLACEEVPLWRRELYAVAVYSGLRQGELRALEASDIDLEHNQILVRRQRGARTKETSRPKTRAGRRDVPIEPNLRPLLEILVKRGGRLLRVPPREDCAPYVRKDLLKAGCVRRDLHVDDDVNAHATFHSLRHTAITHWSVAGRSVSWLIAAAGHSTFTQTADYQDKVAVLRESFGEPHGPLPPSLIALAEPLARASGDQSQQTEPTGKKRWPLRDSKTAENRPDQADSVSSSGNVDEASPTSVAPGFRISPHDAAADPIEATLCEALTAAVAAGRWDVAAPLVAELQARRLARVK